MNTGDSYPGSADAFADYVIMTTLTGVMASTICIIPARHTLQRLGS